MKKYILAALVFSMSFLAVNAQDRPKVQRTSPPVAGIDSLHLDSINFPTGKNIIDTVKNVVPNIFAWKITPRLGERIFLPRDTMPQNFHNSMLVDGAGVAMGYLGNVGSPAQSKIFFERPEASRFMFLDGLYLWRKDPEDQLFLNTKVPYSNIKYQSGGGGERQEQRFQGELSMNMGKKLNVGFDFDYIYSRGFYNSQSNKGISYDFYASYIGDKYKMHAFFHNNNFTILENGGIADSTYILNPDAVRYTGNTLDIPTRMQDTRNKIRGRHLYVTNRYDLGNDMEEYAINDSVTGLRKKKDYIPLASAILTTHYTDQRRGITSGFSGLDDLYKPTPTENANGEIIEQNKYSGYIDDYMAYYSFKNTLALAMNEGFRNWTKFGLTAFIEYDMRKYSRPGGLPGLHTRESENSLTIGGVLSKEKGKYLRYRASGEFDFINSDYKLEGEVTTMFSLWGKNISAKANAYAKGISPSYFQRTFSSKYWNWNEDFNNTQRVYVGGEIIFPEFSFSRTRLRGGVENVTDYIYYGTDRLVHQKSGSVQVVSFRLDQDFQAGIFHWDNQVVYQVTGDKDVIPLPTLSVYSNIYLTTKIAKVLTLQLGADVHYHSKYYMPGYEPLTMQFYNQKNMEIGNFPVVNAYLNLHLKYTRFFMMMYNVADGMGNAESFSLYRYPINPRGFKLGISWQFNN
ncbi:hypothetical protein M2451_000308 [Dysgonomonas sp. PFB1-18]|uniref:putative porin n=1 Tax=unclassified Dysgonomonas TaxID=2630389 RepID=UPI0024760CF5|nr:MULTISPECIES: putative porin [unclassified Dysgonomonas]MDH6307859.1 hypothetical protein [Dysgonomonas sp. PF1-14]MDH6337777.1 hypothetical protein [Dysgonomonas sp. PF1-16]MDH6379001.1 hypothetical protein [Dysgonomonas sp. PFB1-18]MDH6396636.1 hypothetical protein [Dysgonomonas sp. PF1-23]